MVGRDRQAIFLANRPILSYQLLTAGKSWDRQGKGTGHAADIIKAFKSLDVKDQPQFTNLMAVAADEEKLKEARAARVDIRP